MTKKLYYTKALLKNELDKCLSCKDKPCQHACPVGCDPNFFIKKAKDIGSSLVFLAFSLMIVIYTSIIFSIIF